MLHLIYGPDIFRARQHITSILTPPSPTRDSELGTSNSSHPHLSLDGSTITPEKLTNHLQSNQLFSQQQIILIKNLFSSAKQKACQQIMIDYLDHPDENNILIIWEQSELDKRTSFYKKVQKLAKKEQSQIKVKDFPLLNKKELISWLSEYCRNQKINIEPQAITHLVNKNTDTFALANELEKLSLYTNNQITIQSIESLTPPTGQEIIFTFTDQIGANQKYQAYQTALNLYQQNEPAEVIIGSLSAHLQNLLIIHELLIQKKNLRDINQEAGIHPYVVEKLLRQSKNLSYQEVKQLYHRLAEIDIQLKTGQNNFEEAIYYLIFGSNK